MKAVNNQKGLLVEFVGLAGAGKTTVFHELGQRNPNILPKNIPNSRTLLDIPFFTTSCLSILPELLQANHYIGKNLKRREIAWLAILNRWPEYLQALKRKTNKVIAVDQGAVYLLAELYILNIGLQHRPSVEQYWQRIYRKWASVLDLIVLLDAPNSCLVNRINYRSDWHLVKDKPEDQVFEFLEKFRSAYVQIISKLASYPSGPKVLQVNTEHRSVEEVIVMLLGEINLRGSEIYQ